MKVKNINITLTIVILILSVLMIQHAFYWNDETWSIDHTFLDWNSFFEYFESGKDYHPFLYYYLLKLFSHAEFISIEYYKIINFFINIIFASLFFTIGYIQKRSETFYFLLLLFFVNPVSIYLIDEIRHYSVALFLVGSILLIIDHLLKTKEYKLYDIVFLSILLSLLAITNYISVLAIFLPTVTLILKLAKEKLKFFLLLFFPVSTIITYHNMIIGHLSNKIHYFKPFDDSLHFILIVSLTTVSVVFYVLVYLKKNKFMSSLFFQNFIFMLVLLLLIYLKVTVNFLNIGNIYIMYFSLYLLLILNIKTIKKSMYLPLIAMSSIGFIYNLKVLYSPKYIEPNRICPTLRLNNTMCNNDFVIIDWPSTGRFYGLVIKEICLNDPVIKYYTYKDDIEKLTFRSNTYILTRKKYKSTGVEVSDGLYYRK
jgi:hypothetical protein